VVAVSLDVFLAALRSPQLSLSRTQNGDLLAFRHGFPVFLPGSATLLPLADVQSLEAVAVNFGPPQRPYPAASGCGPRLFPSERFLRQPQLILEITQFSPFSQLMTQEKAFCGRFVAV
jgi:hypothetical protein